DIETNDRMLLRAFAMRHSLGLSARQYSLIPQFLEGVYLPSVAHERTRVAQLSHIKSEKYDCCIKSCCCFTGDYADLDQCPFCKASRYTASGAPRKQFSYLPVGPRLVGIYANVLQSERMRYRAQQPNRNGAEFHDFTDGSHYRHLRRKRVFLDGHRQAWMYFSDDCDVALALSTDGFCPFKKRKVTC
ncbi:hypothetical protein EXIGLDRAFT_595860, partial [Exidia glandulosa HHB12029]